MLLYESESIDVYNKEYTSELEKIVNFVTNLDENIPNIFRKKAEVDEHLKMLIEKKKAKKRNSMKRDEHSEYNLLEKETKHSRAEDNVGERKFELFTKGLKNKTNICFLNSLIHALLSLKPLINYYILFDKGFSKLFEQKLESVLPYEFFLQIIQLNVFVAQSYVENNLDEFKEYTKELSFAYAKFKRTFFTNIHMTGYEWIEGEQHDAQEAFIKYIEHVNQRLNDCYMHSHGTTIIFRPDASIQYDGINNLFAIYSRKRLKCLACNNLLIINNKRKPDLAIQLPVTDYDPGDYNNVHGAIKAQCVTFDLPDYKCENPNCGQIGRTTSTQINDGFSDIICIHFLLFQKRKVCLNILVNLKKKYLIFKFF